MPNQGAFISRIPYSEVVKLSHSRFAHGLEWLSRLPQQLKKPQGRKEEMPGAAAVRGSPDTPVCGQPAAIVTTKAEMKDEKKWGGAREMVLIHSHIKAKALLSFSLPSYSQNLARVCEIQRSRSPRF